jgi:hypothetical protein
MICGVLVMLPMIGTLKPVPEVMVGEIAQISVLTG